MGIRIRRQLGQGLAVPENELHNVFNAEVLHNLSDKKIPEYNAFLLNKYGEYDVDDLDMLRLRSDLLWMDSYLDKAAKNELDAYNLVRTHEVSRDGTVLVVFTPLLTVDSWYRYDDSIDYADVEYASQDSEIFSTDTEVKWLRYNQFPYDGSYMNADTGEAISPQEYRTYKTIREVKAKGLEDALKPEGVSAFLERNGFKDWEEATRKVVPEVLHPIRDVAEWLGIFNNPADVLKLRPCLVTSWS